MFQRYYELLAKRNTVTDAERAERLQLERQLAPHRGLGYTRSDQAVYALLDEFLATQGAATQKQARGVSDKVRQQVFDIWRNVAARHRGQA